MSPSIPHLAAVAPGLAPHGAAQHLLDRCLAGFAAEGRFAPRLADQITLVAPGADAALIDRRVRDFGLRTATSLEAALPAVDAALVAWPGPGHAADDALLESVVSLLRPGAACFVHGLMGTHRTAAERIAARAHARGVRLAALTALATTPRLPDLTLRRGVRIDEALIVVQGATPDALLDGTQGLGRDLEAAGVLFDPPLIVRTFSGEAVWTAGQRREWADDLLAAALSRSNNPQGDPVRDGRTQDLHGLGLVPGLARNPRAWITRHPDGCRSTILALDGVVTDINLAVRTRRGEIVSTQLYRPPAPNQSAYGDLVEALVNYYDGAGALPVFSPRHALGLATWHAALREA